MGGLTLTQKTIIVAIAAVTVLVGKTALSALMAGRILRFLANRQADVSVRLATAAKSDSRYLAHEYLNRDWQIVDFAAVAQDGARAKLDYLGSACLLENLDHRSAPAGLLPLLAGQVE